jgi:hypothetical protein
MKRTPKPEGTEPERTRPFSAAYTPKPERTPRRRYVVKTVKPKRDATPALNPRRLGRAIEAVADYLLIRKYGDLTNAAEQRRLAARRFEAAADATEGLRLQLLINWTQADHLDDITSVFRSIGDDKALTAVVAAYLANSGMPNPLQPDPLSGADFNP